jgi:dUTP pyrophosphatase
LINTIKMHLKILPDNESVYNQYLHHSTYHEGDSGLDLYFTEDITIDPKETKIISLGIRCEAFPTKEKEHNISLDFDKQYN